MHCSRHVRDTERSCPFCRAVVVIAVVAATAACGKDQPRPSADIYGAPPVAVVDAGVASVEPPPPDFDRDAGARQLTLYGAPPQKKK